MKTELKHSKINKSSLSIDYNKRFEKKYNKKQFSILYIFLFYIFILLVNLANYLMSSEMISSLLINNQPSNQNNYKTSDLNPDSDKINSNTIIENQYSNCIIRVQIFLKINIILLIIIFFIKLMFFIAFFQIKKKKSKVGKIPDKIAMIKCLKQVCLNEKVIKTSNDFVINSQEKNSDTGYIHKNLKIINNYFLKFISILVIIECIFQFVVLKFFIISTFSAMQLFYLFPYFHSIIVFIFIHFACFNYLINFFGLLFGNALVLIFLDNQIINSILNKEGISHFNVTYECFAMFCGIFIVSALNLRIYLINKKMFLKHKNTKLRLTITNDTLENLNYSFFSFGDNMKINYNKKFSQNFTSLINKIIRNKENHDNNFSFLKTFKIENHYDHKILNFQTKHLPENQPILNKTKRYSDFHIFNKSYNFEKSYLFEYSNKHNPNFERQVSDEIQDEKELSKLILLLIYFNKSNIKLNQDLDFELKKFVEDNLLVNFEPDEFIFKLAVNNNIIDIKQENQQIINPTILDEGIKIKNTTHVKDKNTSNNDKSNLKFQPNLSLHLESKDSNFKESNLRVYAIKNFFFKTKSKNENKLNYNENKNMKNENKNDIEINKLEQVQDLILDKNLNIKNNLQNQDIELKSKENNKKLNNNINLNTSKVFKNDESNLNNSYTNFISNNNNNTNNLIIEKKFHQNIETPNFKGILKNEKNYINPEKLICTYLNQNENDINKKSNFLNDYENKTYQLKEDFQSSQLALNSAFINFLKKMINHFKEFSNIIKTKYSPNDKFVKFFIFKKKIENENFEEVIYLEVFTRYNKYSDKIEFLFNDLSDIRRISNIKGQKKMKKMFLNKLSHEFRNPILNIMQILRNLKQKIFENNHNTKLKNSINNHKTDIKDFINSKESNFLNKHKSSYDNSDRSEKTTILNNVEFSSFAIVKELLEKENFFNRNLQLSNDNSYCSSNSNKNQNDIGAGLFNSRTNFEMDNPQKLKNFTFISNKEIKKNKISQKDQINKNSLKDLIIQRKNGEDFSNDKKEKNKIKTMTDIKPNNAKPVNLTQENNYCEFIDFKSNLTNDNLSNTICQMTLENNNQSSPQENYSKSNKVNIQTSSSSTMNFISNNQSNNINNFEDNLKIVNYEINSELNSIKYICCILDYQINDFDFITNIDLYEKNVSHSTCDIESSEIYTEKNWKDKIKLQNERDIDKNINFNFNFHKLLIKVIKIFKAKLCLTGKKIVLNLDIEESVPKNIISSSEKIVQILFNLLSNSLKFTKVGYINLNIKYIAEESKLIFNLMDSGIGIKQEFLSKIFKPFFKVNDDKNNIYGMGLGLFIAKFHIESLNGKIEVESNVNESTSITFFILIENEKNYLIENSYELSSELLGNSNIRSSNDELKKFSIKRKTSNNLDCNYANLNEKSNLLHQSIKTNELIEFENSSVLDKNSYEENLVLESNKIQEFKKKRINSNYKNNINSQKENEIEDILFTSNEFQKFPTIDNNIQRKTFIKDVRKYEVSINMEIKSYNSFELSFEKVPNIFKSLLGYNDPTIIETIRQSKKIPQDYCLFINNEFPVHDVSHTTRNFNSNNYEYYEKKSRKSIKKLPDINHVPSKFSNNTFTTNSFKNDSNDPNLITQNMFDKYSKVPSGKDHINSDSSLCDFFNKISNLMKNSSKTNSNFIINPNIVAKDLNSSNNKNRANDDNTSKNLLNSNESKERKYNCKSNSTQTLDFEKEYNFNYNVLKSANPVIYQMNNNESDETYLNKSYLNKIVKPKTSQTFLSLSNLGENQNKSINKIDNTNSNKINYALEKENSNLMLSKNNENKNISARLAGDKYKLTNNLISNSKEQSQIIADKIRILVVDDEKLIRQTNSNLIRKYFRNKNVNFEIYECEDGFDCLNFIYQAKLVGINFNYIITDQTMNYITGTLLSDIIEILIDNKIIKPIKMFLVTSYSASLFDKQKNLFKKIFSKPIRMEHLEYIFNE